MNSDILEFQTVNYKILKSLALYIWFAFIFYSVSFLGGGGVRFHEGVPWYVLISRDFVWAGFLVYWIRCIKWPYLWKRLSEIEYGRFLKIFAFLCGIYLLIVIVHLSHREFREIVQHNIRNILFYSLILPFLPFCINSKEDIYFLIKTFLEIGVVLSLFGIISRYINLDFFTWEGRIISTMSGPNNLGIFLSFCLLAIVSIWEKLGTRKAALYFLLYSFALVLTNSITAFLTVNFALFLLLVLKKGWVRAFALSLVVFYIYIGFSFLTKIIESNEIHWNTFLQETYNVDKYLVDKLDRISRGLFSKLFLPGINIPSPDDDIRSMTYRTAQLKAMFNLDRETSSLDMKDISQVNSIWLSLGEENVKEMYGIKKGLTLFGNFELKKYATFDQQYFNFIFNDGVVSAIIFLGLFLWGALTGIKNYFKLKKDYNDFAMILLSFSVYLLSMTLVAFNATSFLNRFPINFFIYISLGLIFVIKELPNQTNYKGNL